MTVPLLIHLKLANISYIITLYSVARSLIYPGDHLWAWMTAISTRCDRIQFSKDLTNFEVDKREVNELLVDEIRAGSI